MGFSWVCGCGMLAALLLAGCSGSEASQASQGGFRPLPTVQPTNGVAFVDPSDPMTLYALGPRSMRSRDGGRTWAALNWPKGAQSLHIARTPTRALYLEVQASPADATNEILKS